MMQRLKKYFSFFLIAFILLFVSYTWVSLHWVYSSGERVGYVQKFSLKGYFCKTWEGELILVSMPGTQAEKFTFTVKDQAVAQKINHALGSRIRLVYEEHKGIPLSCFGDSAYFVTNIQLLNQ